MTSDTPSPLARYRAAKALLNELYGRKMAAQARASSRAAAVRAAGERDLLTIDGLVDRALRSLDVARRDLANTAKERRPRGPKAIDMVGRKLNGGRVEVVARGTNAGAAATWCCRCACGAEFTRQGFQLREIEKDGRNPCPECRGRKSGRGRSEERAYVSLSARRSTAKRTKGEKAA